MHFPAPLRRAMLHARPALQVVRQPRESFFKDEGGRRDNYLTFVVAAPPGYPLPAFPLPLQVSLRL